jgi:chitin synthase
LAISSQLVEIAKNGKKKSKILSGASKMEVALESFGSFKSTLDEAGWGRVTEYQYSATGRMIGVKLMHYGFQLARVVNGAFLPDGERPYHILYQLLAGASAKERTDLFLSDSTGFYYTKGGVPAASTTLSRSGTLTRKLTLSRNKSISKKNGNGSNNSSVDAQPTPIDGEKFATLKENLKSLGIGKRNQAQIWKILAAILHLGNIGFMDDETKPQEPAAVKNPEVLGIASSLLSLPQESLKNALLYKSKTIGRDTFSTFLKAEGAAEQRDHLASTLYSLIFTWILEHINERLAKPEEEVHQVLSIVDFPFYQKVAHGLDSARMDTFFANYAMERVILALNSRVIDETSAIFYSQGISFSTPSYIDNQFAIDVYDGTPRLAGLWTLLENRLEIIPADSTVGKEMVKILDSTLKANPFYISISTSTKAMFGVKHFTGSLTVDYDLDSFSEEDSALTDFVALFRGLEGLGDGDEKEKTFLSSLFSPRNGLQAIKNSKGKLCGAKKTDGPLRKPSMKGKKTPTASETAPVELGSTAITELMEAMRKARVWSVYCIEPSKDGIPFNEEFVQQQIDFWNIPSLAALYSQYDVDRTMSISYEDFLSRYGTLIATVGGSRAGLSPADQVQFFIRGRQWPAKEVAFGSSLLFLSSHRWRWILSAMRRIAGVTSTVADSASPTSIRVGEVIPTTRTSWEVPQSHFGKDEDSYSEYSDGGSLPESDYNFDDRRRTKSGKQSDLEMGPLSKLGSPPEQPKQEFIQKSEDVTRSRKMWVCCTWLLTWWIPSIFLSYCGKMKRSDIRMAWREKVAICIIILMMCSSLLFLIIGLSWIICPPVNVLSPAEVNSKAHPMTGGKYAWFSAYGNYFYAEKVMSSHLKAYGEGSGAGALGNYLFKDFYGQDISNLFWRQDSWGGYCPGIPAPNATWDNMDPNLVWQKRTGMLSQFQSVHRNNVPGQPAPRYIDNLYQYTKGKVGYTKETVSALSSATMVTSNSLSNPKIYVILYDNVYYVSTMASAGVFPREILSLFSSQNSGTDITLLWNTAKASSRTPQIYDSTLTCINRMFYIGTVDRRNTIQCSLSSALLFGASIVLVAVIGIKFIAALQFGTKADPEQSDKFAILMVPCYTEGVESLSKTLDSLATFSYDDRRKLLFVICDGMVIGSGNDRPTPRIVLDILGVDPTQDPEPLAFQSLGEGEKQYNMAKVYSGLYDIRGHSVPFVVVVKCGSRSERVKPGNRGLQKIE